MYDKVEAIAPDKHGIDYAYIMVSNGRLSQLGSWGRYLSMLKYYNAHPELVRDETYSRLLDVLVGVSSQATVDHLTLGG